MISEPEILALVDSGARESRALEFKRDLYEIDDPKKRNDARRELFADVIAFANSGAGMIVIGVAEKDEVAVEAPGVALDAATEFAKKLPELLLRNIEPPLRSVVAEIVRRSNAADRAFMVLRVAQSPDAPHRDSSSRIFYERLGAQKSPMDIERVRTAFLGGEVAYNLFETFRSQRLQRNLHQQATGGAWWGKEFPVVMLHARPLHALSRHARRQLDFQKLKPRNTMDNAFGVDESTFNAEGFLRYNRATADNGGFGFQVFHDGSYECISAGTLWKGKMLFRQSDLGRLIAQSWQHMSLIDSQLGTSSWLVAVSAWNLRDATLGLPHDRVVESSATDDTPIECYEVRFESLSERNSFAQQLGPSLQPIFTGFKLPGVSLPSNEQEWEKILSLS